MGESIVMSMDVAKAILAQLGGDMIVAMTGAQKLAGGEYYLHFRLPGSGGFCEQGLTVSR